MSKRVGAKPTRLVYDAVVHDLLAEMPVSPADRARLSLDDDDALALARWATAIERHFSGKPMVAEWAKDGVTGELFMLQARASEVVEAPTAGQLPRPRTKVMLIVGEPEQALSLALLPSDGVGLARMEHVLGGTVGVHPLAVTRYRTLPPETRREVDRLTVGYSDRIEFFVDRLSQGIALIAAAFFPRPVIVRFSDFTTTEYARLVGGAAFEPHEENPMLGWRGASRYYHPAYRDGFLLEVAAVRRVRETMGFENVAVMIPFCRTPEEGVNVLEAMRAGGLVRGERGLEVHVMAEIPSNILLADRFAELFDGFSIGSTDLTQLTLGIDRDAAAVAALFDERNEAVKLSCARLIETAHACGRKVGICGRAPADHPDFAEFLVERGIDAISVSADALEPTTRRILAVEQTLGRAPSGRRRGAPSARPARTSGRATPRGGAKETRGASR
ncbi:MAG: ppsA [Labilithrix sp.]|nr:ppsA [Labilithrix sp.]